MSGAGHERTPCQSDLSTFLTLKKVEVHEVGGWGGGDKRWGVRVVVT